MANAYEPRTHLADRLLSRNDRGPTVGFGSNLFARLGLSDPFAGGDVSDRSLNMPRLDYLSSRAYLAELRGLTKRRFQLLERISGMRRALSSHDRFQRRISTTAVRAAALGMDETTLIDWSSQVEDEGVENDEEEVEVQGRARSTGSVEQSSATRALRGEITAAGGVLAQLQKMLDSQRSNTDRGLQGRLADLQQLSPVERAQGAHKMARELRGVAAVAARATGVGRRVETSGERPLAVAQARQQEGASQGLRRVLGESPVIMTLEEPEAVQVADEATPPRRRAARPTAVEPQANARASHAGRVARVADEARSQGSVGRAGPPARPASTPSASQAVGAPKQRSVPSAVRPTERVARAAVAASNAPLTDVRRGLKALAPSTVASARPANVAVPQRSGLERTAARVEAGLADTQGRVTGATRYLATPESVPVTSQVAEYTDAVYRRLDVAGDTSEVGPVSAIAANAPLMQVPEGADDAVESPEATADRAAAPRRRAAPATARPGSQASATARPGSQASATARPGSQASATARPGSQASATARPASQAPAARPTVANASSPRVSQLPPIARAMQRAPRAAAPVGKASSRTTPLQSPTATVAASERRLGVAKSVVVPQAVSRANTGTGPAPVSARSAERGALRTTVAASAKAPRVEASESTGIARRSRALPTVRAAARTLSQERWGTRGRMLTPSVSRFVEATDFDQIQADGRSPLAGRVIPAAVAEPVFATAAPDATDTASETARERFASAGPTASARRSASAVPVTPAGVGAPASTAAAGREPIADRTLASTARAAERAEVHPRRAEQRTSVLANPVAPFEAPSVPSAVEERLVERASSGRGTPVDSAPRPEETSSLRSLADRVMVDAVLASPEAAADPVAVEAGSIDRAARRGQEIVPAARRSLVPAATPEAQTVEAHRVAARAERQLESTVAARTVGRSAEASVPESAEDAPLASPFRRSNRSGSVTSSVDPVLVRSLHQDVPAPAVADSVASINRRAETTRRAPVTRRATRAASRPTPTSEVDTTPTTAGLPTTRTPVALGARPSAARPASVEGAVARAERRSQSTRTSIAQSPVLSSRSFGDEVATVAERGAPALAPDAVFAEGFVARSIEGATAPAAHQESPATVAAASAVRSDAKRGLRRARPGVSRARTTARALDRSRARRDVNSMVPHPVGTPRTARASTRMLDRAQGSIAAPEGVLVQAQEVVDLAPAVGDTSTDTRVLPLNERVRSRLGDTAGGERASVDDVRPSQTVLHDGMTFADAAAPSHHEAGAVPVAESIAGGRRAVGRLPGEDRSRFAPRARPSKAAVQSVIQDASVLRAAERGQDPVVALSGSRRAYGAPSNRSARYEARVTQGADGTVLKTVVVDTVTGEEIATRQVQAAGARSTAVERAEARENAVQTVDGRPRASVGGQAPEPVLASPERTVAQAEATDGGRAPLGQTFNDLTARQAVQGEQRGPMVRRRTWNRRQLAHEIGEFAPAMAEAEFLEAPVASEDAPAWARRAVSGTSVSPKQTRSGAAARTPGAVAARGDSDLVEEDGVARAWEPNSLLGALSRADAPEDLIKVIVEHRTEVRTVRESLPSEAVRIVERLASLSPEEANLLTSSDRALASGPRTSLAAPSRNARGGKEFTQLSGTTDGAGANRLMKLADKLMGLIHLAENSRVSDAHRQVQMSQEAVAAAASGDIRGMGQGVDFQSMSREQLHSDVFKELHKQLEKLKAQKGEF